MMRMKHLLKRLHLSSAAGDLRPSDPPPPPPPPSTSSSSSPGKTDFRLFEEEYQMQLALAISVSDPDGREDPESAQINAAKRISLGCTPVGGEDVGGSEKLVEILSQRYWNYNILDYNEKVMDGFYDVYGILTSSLQVKMPLLLDLQAASVTDNVDYEVVLVDRITDHALQQLEKQAISIAKQCKVKEDPSASGLIQKISDLVVNCMGGPVDNADDMLKKWTIKSYEMRAALNTIVLPLGFLKVGLSRHRALLFKVLADRIELPCKLMKGSYYTGTDEGAVNLIRIGQNKEFIVDLMGAPGTLIPAEMPSCNFQNAEFDLVNANTITQNVKDLSLALDSNTNWQLEGKAGEAQRNSADVDRHPGSVGLQAEESSISGQSLEKVNMRVKEKNDTEKFEHDFGQLLPSLTNDQVFKSGSTELDTAARQMKVSDVSKYVVSAAKNPEFAQKLHAVLLESGASPPPDLFSDRHSSDHQELGIVVQQKPGALSPFAKPPLFPVSKKDSPGCDHANWDKGEQGHSRKETQKQAEGSDLANPNPGIPSAVAPRMEILPYREFNKINHKSEDIPSQQEHCHVVSGGAQCSTESSVSNVDVQAVLDDVSECEIPWEDLQIGERIGLGSYGEVYRADWNGTEVAVKKFLDQDLYGYALEQFRCEIKIMLRLRHPNVVLFMGAVTRPPNLSILTEFLPRGSLYRLLHRPKIHIDEKRRLKMAVDVAKGMNYLHTSHPIIVHRDLKSPNLLVDKNWVVKVSDFGLSRLKLHTFLSSKSTAGTPEWMAPEVLRNEPSNEKCDVYSFGVILWELATLQMPWSGMNPMQVVGAVGFQNRRLEIPKEIDPQVAEIICNCWHNDPDQRPSFTQLMGPLKRLQRLVVGNI